MAANGNEKTRHPEIPMNRAITILYMFKQTA